MYKENLVLSLDVTGGQVLFFKAKRMDSVINWFEIPAEDLARAAAFYSGILGKDLVMRDYMGVTMAFFPMEGREGVGGTVVKVANVRPSTDGTIVYLNVNGRLDEVLRRVEPAGGEVLMPRTDIGDPGFIATIRDTEGNRVGLHSMS
jgi:predicted enzyme related to lactoylglutathione lyase